MTSAVGRVARSSARCGVSACPSGRLEDHVRPLLGDHDRGRVGVAGGDGRHDRRIDDAQSGQSSQLQRRIDDGGRIRAHAAGADRVEDRRPDLAGGMLELVLRHRPGARLDLGRRMGREGLAFEHDRSCQADRVGGDAPIRRIAEIVGLDQRRRRRIG